MMKNTYDKVLQSLKEIKTIASHMTALGKVLGKTEDEQLEKLLHQAARILSQARQAKVRTPLLSSSETAPAVAALVQYCTKHASEPEWKVIAKREGWTPPD